MRSAATHLTIPTRPVGFLRCSGTHARSPQQHHTARAQLGHAAAGYEQRTREETRSVPCSRFSPLVKARKARGNSRVVAVAKNQGGETRGSASCPLNTRDWRPGAAMGRNSGGSGPCSTDVLCNHPKSLLLLGLVPLYKSRTPADLNMTHKRKSMGRPRPSHMHGYCLYSNLPVISSHPYCDNGTVPLNKCLQVTHQTQLQLSTGNGEAAWGLHGLGAGTALLTCTKTQTRCSLT